MVGGEVQVVVKNRRLVISALSPLRALRTGLELHPVDPNELMYAVCVEGLVVPVAFGRGESGDVDRVLLGPPANAVFRRRSPLRSSRVRWQTAGAVGAGLLAARTLTRRRRR
jgi:hypothetical protein